MQRILMLLMPFALLVPQVCAEETIPPLERYRNLEFRAEPDNFDKGWRERVVLEFEIVNDEELETLRTGLSDEDPYVRSMAARALGIRGDKASADVLAELALSDPEFMVRIRAVESLGLLKTKLDVIESAKKDPQGAVRWSADLAADQFHSEDDYAAEIRKAFAEGINLEEMGQAEVGQPAPDFTALTLDGEFFELSSVLGRKPIAIYFAAFDQ